MSNISRSGFLNHIVRTLNSSLQQWEFIEPSNNIVEPPYILPVRFANGHEAGVGYIDGKWIAASANTQLADYLTARLRGHVRDDAGNLQPVGKAVQL